MGFHFTREFPSGSHCRGGASLLQASALSRACTPTPAVPARQGRQHECHECIGRANSVRRQACVLALVCLPESAFPADWLLTVSPAVLYFKAVLSVFCAVWLFIMRRRVGWNDRAHQNRRWSLLHLPESRKLSHTTRKLTRYSLHTRTAKGTSACGT